MKYLLEGFGCTVLASEQNDFGQPLDENSYNSCIEMVKRADHFVLLIGVPAANLGGLLFFLQSNLEGGHLGGLASVTSTAVYRPPFLAYGTISAVPWFRVNCGLAYRSNWCQVQT